MLKTMIIASLLPLTALAANAGSWSPAPGHDEAAPRAVYSETENGTALLTCNSEGKFTAILSKATQDFPSILEKSAPYRRGVDVELRTSDRMSKDTWVAIPAIETIVSASHSNAAKIYNAVVRGEALTVLIEGKDFLALQLPAVDENFKAFAKTCRT